MPGRKKRTNPLLFLIALILCLLLGILLTGSSAKQPSVSSGTSPDTFVAKEADDPASLSKGTVTDNDSRDDPADDSNTDSEDDPADDSNEDPEEDPADDSDKDSEDNPEEDSETSENTPTETPVPTETPEKEETEDTVFPVSPEAETGVWTPSGSNWMFLVDGTPYTGWLTDTDGHRYYFNSEGIMQTGWLDDSGKRYYLDLDGIMQTGEITVGKETYQFLPDGSLKDYTADSTPTPEPQKEAEEDTQQEAKKESAASSDSKERKTIALTFDDGPSSFTNRLLDCLEANNAKATFFLVGEEASYFPEEVKRIASLGYELGNHTYSHVDLTTLSADGIAAEINKTDELVTELTGQATTLLRPPYGSINDDVCAAVKTPMFVWSVDTLDWQTLDAQQTVDTVLAQAQDGAVILMHDIYSETVDAAEILIPALIEQGYELVTLHELAEAHGIELQAGIAYGALTNETAGE